MKKILSALIIMVATLALVACDSTPAERSNPVITGLPATAEIMQGESINVLQGVTAKAHGDVDITNKIVVTTDPSTATIVDGVVTPQESGSYLIKLSVADPKNEALTATATLFLDVVENLVVVEKNRVVYDFNSITTSALEGFVSKEAGVEVNALSVANGALIYTPITSGNGDGDNQILKFLNFEANSTYTISLEAKASRNLTGVAFVINGKTPGEWDPYAGAWGQEIGTEYKTYTHIRSRCSKRSGGINV